MFIESILSYCSWKGVKDILFAPIGCPVVTRTRLPQLRYLRVSSQRASHLPTTPHSHLLYLNLHGYTDTHIHLFTYLPTLAALALVQCLG